MFHVVLRLIVIDAFVIQSDNIFFSSKSNDATSDEDEVESETSSEYKSCSSTPPKELLRRVVASNNQIVASHNRILLALHELTTQISILVRGPQSQESVQSLQSHNIGMNDHNSNDATHEHRYQVILNSVGGGWNRIVNHYMNQYQTSVNDSTTIGPMVFFLCHMRCLARS